MLSDRPKDGPHGQRGGFGEAGRQAQFCQPHLLLEVWGHYVNHHYFQLSFRMTFTENENNSMLSEEIGALAESLKIFQKYKVFNINSTFQSLF